MKIRVPEDVFRKLVRSTDGRRQRDWVEVVLDGGILQVEYLRTGERIAWDRLEYERLQTLVKRSFV